MLIRHKRFVKGMNGLSFAIAVVALGCAIPGVSIASTTGVKPLLLPPTCDVVRAHVSYADLGPMVAPPSVIAPIFGRTQTEVDQHFTAVIESNFDSIGAERVLNQLTDSELAGLAARYKVKAGTNGTKLLAIFASRLSDRALLRVASAFGTDAVVQAVNAHASPAVKASFLAKVAMVTPLVLTPMQAPGGGILPPPPPPSTNWTNTLQDIYLDYRTSPTLELGVGESLSATAIYTVGAVAGAWEAGTQIGNGINYLITNYDPSLGDAIGGTVAGMINAGNTAATELEQGHLQNAFDSLFGLPISNSTDPSGPDNLTAPMVDYYDVYGPPDAGYDGGDGGCDD